MSDYIVVHENGGPYHVVWVEELLIVATCPTGAYANQIAGLLNA